MRGQVVRHFEDGLAIEFAVIQRPETLDQRIRRPPLLNEFILSLDVFATCAAMTGRGRSATIVRRR